MWDDRRAYDLPRLVFDTAEWVYGITGGCLGLIWEFAGINNTSDDRTVYGMIGRRTYLEGFK